jgi:hypothetical protein
MSNNKKEGPDWPRRREIRTVLPPIRLMLREKVVVVAINKYGRGTGVGFGGAIKHVYLIADKAEISAFA